MALTKTPIELSSTPSIVDGGNATAITIDSSEDVTLANNLNITSSLKVSGGTFGFGTSAKTDSHTGWNQFYIGQKGSVLSENATGTHGLDGLWLTDNLYVDSDTGSFSNIETNESSAIKLEAGQLHFYSQASGSAGAAVTLSSKFNINSSGDVTIGGNLIIPSTITHDGDSDTKLDFNQADTMRLITGDNTAWICNTTSMTVNEDSQNFDFRVESDSYSHLIFADASTNHVAIASDTATSCLKIGTRGVKNGIQLAGGPNGNATCLELVDSKTGSFSEVQVDVQLSGAGGYHYQIQYAGTGGAEFQTGGGYTNNTANFSHNVTTGSGFTVTSPSSNVLRLVSDTSHTHPVLWIKVSQGLAGDMDEDDVTITFS